MNNNNEKKKGKRIKIWKKKSEIELENKIKITLENFDKGIFGPFSYSQSILSKNFKKIFDPKDSNLKVDKFKTIENVEILKDFVKDDKELEEYLFPPLYIPSLLFLCLNFFKLKLEAKFITKVFPRKKEMERYLEKECKIKNRDIIERILKYPNPHSLDLDEGLFFFRNNLFQDYTLFSKNMKLEEYFFIYSENVKIVDNPFQFYEDFYSNFLSKLKIIDNRTCPEIVKILKYISMIKMDAFLSRVLDPKFSLNFCFHLRFLNITFREMNKYNFDPTSFLFCFEKNYKTLF